MLDLEKEGARMLKHVTPDAFCIALDLRGKQSTSELFAGHLQHLREQGDGKITFVIGASLGLSGEVLRRADETLSLSEMTFPHQLARVVLLEQLYRSFRIINNEPYHK